MITIRLPLFSLLLLTLLSLCPVVAEEVDSIVAVVNDDVIVRSELDAELSQLVSQLRQQGTRIPPRSVLERQVLERLILKKLQLAAARQAGITVSDGLLTQALKNIATENGMSLDEFHRALDADGIGFGRFRDSIRDQITISRLREQRVIRRIEVSQQELDNYLKKEAGRLDQRSDYHLFHILIAVPEGASPEQIADAKSRAEQLLARIRRGEIGFKEAAVAESDGRQALESGDLGWRNAAQLPGFFLEPLAAMKRGDVSEVMRNSSGFHIVLLDDFKGGERKMVTQTRARHILIRTNEITSDEDARNRLAQLKQRIEEGDDFAVLARSHSDDKGSAIKGGDLGWTNPGDFVQKFETVLDGLEIGQISEPFQSQFGWHIVQLLERREHDNTEEVQKALARDAIRERKAAEEVELYLRRLRDEAYVEIRLPEH
ncbi:MAG: peptidylprolyl isomerase [Candidatus Polarisedimenticolaceae bacterium]|nr:peptidylprolyl isomerase [Candidatus Polarisedimenticolaceae bacterium]